MAKSRLIGHSADLHFSSLRGVDLQQNLTRDFDQYSLQINTTRKQPQQGAALVEQPTRGKVSLISIV